MAMLPSQKTVVQHTIRESIINQYKMTIKNEKQYRKLMSNGYLSASDSPATYGALQMCFD